MGSFSRTFQKTEKRQLNLLSDRVKPFVTAIVTPLHRSRSTNFLSDCKAQLTPTSYIFVVPFFGVFFVFLNLTIANVLS